MKTNYQMPTTCSKKSHLLLRFYGLVLACALLVGSFANAQSTLTLITADETNGTIKNGDTLEMEVGRQAIVVANWDIVFVGVANPEIAAVNIMTDNNDEALNEVRVVSESIGTTDLIIRGVQGEYWACKINVDINPERLRDDLIALFPNCKLRVTRSEDVYFIQGIMQKSNEVENMHSFLEKAGINFVDMTMLAGLHQVQIAVRVAEVNRTAIKRMANNSLYGADQFIGASSVGSAAGGSISPIGIIHDTSSAGIPFIDGVAGNSPLVTLFAGFPNSDLSFFIQALKENQYLNLLAEPTLVALSGEEASFLAGGEFPIPVGQDNNKVTIEFKEVGIRLKFRPEVLGDGTIRLNIDTEVSEISDFGAIELQGFKIPSIITRRVETTLEMKSGQTFTMAGLLNHSTNVKNSRVPFLGDIPVLGALFRSVSYQLGETELVVLVTPSLVEPVSYAEPPVLPGEQYVPPNDWALMALGNIGRTESDGESADPDALLQLKGPGAWEDHREDTSAHQKYGLPN